jgi:transcriptional regulator of arginine metabolism
MNALKSSRQEAIAQVIRSGGVGSQEELAERLAALGFTATQATISRDLEQLGAFKVRKDGQSSYALPDGTQPGAGEPLIRLVFRDWVQEVAVAGNLVVIKTPPGSAHLVGVSLDQSSLADVVGTICGDDTIFVATPGTEAAQSLSAKLAELAGL